MASAFQSNAFQNNAFQIEGIVVTGNAFQCGAFQTNAFQMFCEGGGGEEIAGWWDKLNLSRTRRHLHYLKPRDRFLG